MHTADFHYDLPPELIAQVPALQRDQSRLMVFRRESGRLEHRHFAELAEFLRPGDVLALNDSKVIRARLRGRKVGSSGQVEVLLVEEIATNDWWVMLRPGRRVRIGTRLQFASREGELSPVTATVADKNLEGHCRLVFTGCADVSSHLEELGEAPLPPYILRPGGATPEDADRYQTVYARVPGSVAAPTAGLHFTGELLERLRERGIEVCRLTLHVGRGTFAPVKARDIESHVLHEERYSLGLEAARTIRRAKREGRRVVAVGTTTTRVLETAALEQGGALEACSGRTRLFVHPPFRFRVVDVLLTNFHLPESTLLMLVCAFAAPGGVEGRERVLAAYAEAVRKRYRFFSYGDAMLLV